AQSRHRRSDPADGVGFARTAGKDTLRRRRSGGGPAEQQPNPAMGRNNTSRRIAAEDSKGTHPASCQTPEGNTRGTRRHQGETENRGRWRGGGTPPLRRRTAQDGRLLSGIELPDRRPNPPARQPPPGGTARARTHQAVAAPSLEQLAAS